MNPDWIRRYWTRHTEVIFKCGFSTKVTCELIQYLSHFLADKGFKGIIVTPLWHHCDTNIVKPFQPLWNGHCMKGHMKLRLQSLQIYYIYLYIFINIYVPLPLLRSVFRNMILFYKHWGYADHVVFILVNLSCLHLSWAVFNCLKLSFVVSCCL